MIGPSQPMKRCRPPSRSMSSSPGRQEEVKGVAEHHVVAERRDLGGQQALDGRLRGQRDEGGVGHCRGRCRTPARACESRVACFDAQRQPWRHLRALGAPVARRDHRRRPGGAHLVFHRPRRLSRAFCAGRGPHVDRGGHRRRPPRGGCLGDNVGFAIGRRLWRRLLTAAARSRSTAGGGNRGRRAVLQPAQAHLPTMGDGPPGSPRRGRPGSAACAGAACLQRRGRGAGGRRRCAGLAVAGPQRREGRSTRSGWAACSLGGRGDLAGPATANGTPRTSWRPRSTRGARAAAREATDREGAAPRTIGGGSGGVAGRLVRALGRPALKNRARSLDHAGGNRAAASLSRASEC